MPVKEISTTTGAYVLLRTLGGTIGISIGDTIYASELRRRLPSIVGYNPGTGASVTNDIAGLSQIEVG